MNTFRDFGKWLLDRNCGKPDFLTRAGVPRIVRIPVIFFLVLYLSYVLMRRFASPTDKQRLSLAAHNPFLLLAYVAIYVAVVMSEYLEFCYQLKGLRLNERDRIIRQNWKDVFVKIYFLSGASALIFFLIGALIFSHQIK